MVILILLFVINNYCVLYSFSLEMIHQEKESLDHQTKKILIQEMLDQQEKLEQQRGHNLQLINDP